MRLPILFSAVTLNPSSSSDSNNPSLSNDILSFRLSISLLSYDAADGACPLDCTTAISCRTVIVLLPCCSCSRSFLLFFGYPRSTTLLRLNHLGDPLHLQSHFFFLQPEHLISFRTYRFANKKTCSNGHI